MQKKGFYLLKGCIMRGAAGQMREVLGEGSHFIAGSFLVCNELSLWKACACAPLERKTQGSRRKVVSILLHVPCAITHPWDTAQSGVASGPEHPLWGAKGCYRAPLRVQLPPQPPMDHGKAVLRCSGCHHKSIIPSGACTNESGGSMRGSLSNVVLSCSCKGYKSK